MAAGAAGAAPNGNGNGHHHHQHPHPHAAGQQFNDPAEQLRASHARAFERSLRRRIRMLGETITRLERMYTFFQASNRGTAALLGIIDRINRANARRSTLYTRLHGQIRHRRRQQQPPRPPGDDTANNINGNNDAPPAADGN
ncbi:hypothetical protein GUJ93_ZPchr0004g40092 [Zizania palustris]|uniref:Uncharacterized protein n=1 Tax=Zizania palustris TaxID=103762 RepID=A0A8J5S827_ZIZPA|nr:hypothetical protein GUJ93_ZPchr0004g40092 [Zizania palustris]